MAVTFMCGFEAQAAAVDAITITGTAAYNTTTKRTGAAAMRLNPASGASAELNYTSTGTAWWKHFSLYIATLPSVSRVISGYLTGSNVRLNADGTLSVYDGITLVGTSASALSTGLWYWIGHRKHGGTSVPLLQIDGVTVVTGTVGTGGDNIGPSQVEASAIDIYMDDWIVDDAGFLGSSKVGLLLPISDNARASLWTAGSGGTTNLYDAVNNTPPAGLATESDTSQIEHAGGAAGTTDAYDANMTTYTTAGVGAADTVLAVQGIVVWGEDSATGTKLLSYSGVSNPAWTGESSIDVSTGDGSGATLDYGTGPPDRWNERRGTLTTSPSVTLGTSPVMRVLRPETASRVASVCFMGMVVAWTPAAAETRVPRFTPYPQLLAH